MTTEAILPSPTFSYASNEVGPLSQRMIRLIERCTGQPMIRRMYEAYTKLGRPPELFWKDAIEALRLDVRLNRSPLAALPASGPHVVIANHPYGVVDGIILCWMVSQIRSDYKIMTHAILYQAPEVRSHIIPIDFSGTPEALANNLRSRKAAEALLMSGGVLIVFPSGGVAKSRGFRGPAIDLDWGTFAAKLILRSGANVLPVFFNGQNSRLYQIAANLHQTLKLSLLFHEVVNKVGSRITAHIGDMICNEDLQSIGGRRAVTAYLQQVTKAARFAAA
jgi:putative hemolysin